MQRYRDWKPTTFDCAGLGLEDRQDWFVAPVMRTRDTVCALTLSNFEAVLRLLGGESETVEVHGFNHWGPGWFEIILAAPEHEGALQDIEARLGDYPALDEDRMSEIECEQEAEDWEAWGHSDFCSELEDSFTLSESTLEWFATNNRAWDLYQAKTSGTEHGSEGARFCWGNVVRMPRRELAQWIIARRREERARVVSDS